MKKSFVVSFGHLMRGDAFGLLDRTASSALDRSAPDSPVSTEELSQRLPGAINITNFTAFDEYFVLEYKNAKSAGFSLGWIARQEGKECYTAKYVIPYPLGQMERATCFEAYEIEGEDFLFTRAGFYKMSNDTVEEIRSFPADRYASVQYSHSLRAFLYIDLENRSLYLSKLNGETRGICKGQVIEEGSSLEGKNPYDPKLLAYPMEGRLSGQMILYWYFHADGKRTLRICDLEGNVLCEMGPNDQEFLPFDPEWWGSGFAREDAFLLWGWKRRRMITLIPPFYHI